MRLGNSAVGSCAAILCWQQRGCFHVPGILVIGILRHMLSVFYCPLVFFGLIIYNCFGSLGCWCSVYLRHHLCSFFVFTASVLRLAILVENKFTVSKKKLLCVARLLLVFGLCYKYLSVRSKNGRKILKNYL
jgi:hypothetical protein